MKFLKNWEYFKEDVITTYKKGDKIKVMDNDTKDWNDGIFDRFSINNFDQIIYDFARVYVDDKWLLVDVKNIEPIV
jgi:hypothetical protein